MFEVTLYQRNRLVDFSNCYRICVKDLLNIIGKSHSSFDMKMYYHEEKSMQSNSEGPKKYHKPYTILHS